MQFQEAFQTHIVQVFGEQGREWLDRLPALINECTQRWNIRLEEPFALSFNYVAPGVRADGSPVVFKIGVPSLELFSEMEALRLYDGRGVARLIESDPERGALLMERVRPGSMLSDMIDDEAATRIIAGMMRRIWRPLTSEQARPFPTLERWTQAFPRLREANHGGTGSFPKAVFERAEGLRRELLASQGEMVLLHGDLHHDNVLRAEREPWLVIDPKGLAGEREFEIGPILYNPWQRVLSWPDQRAVADRRLGILAEELGFDRQKITRWAYVNVVLSMLWSLEGNDPRWNDLMPIAEALDGMLN